MDGIRQGDCNRAAATAVAGGLNGTFGRGRQLEHAVTVDSVVIVVVTTGCCVGVYNSVSVYTSTTR